MVTRAQRQFRAHVSRQGMPAILLWIGIIYAAAALVTAAMVPEPGPVALILDLPVAALLIVVSAILRSPRVPDLAAGYLFAGAMVVLCIDLAIQPLVFDDYSGLLNVTLIILVLGAAVGSWRAYVPSVVVVGVAYAVAAFAVVPDQWVTWVLAACAAIGGGAALLHIRVTTLDSLGEARDQVRELAIRDQLTGLLNRHGFDEVAPAVQAQAERDEGLLFACFLDLDAFKRANDTFGHEFGDQVLVAVAAAMRSAFRQSDLLARWGGDEFVALGIGDGPDPETVSRHIGEAVRERGIDPDRWPGQVTVGKACGASSEPVDGLLLEADEDMYRRKVARRAGGSSTAEAPTSP